MLKFQKMLEMELHDYKDNLLKRYARDLTANLQIPFEKALERAKMHVSSLLDNGLHTCNQYIFHIVEEANGEKIGFVWLNFRENENQAFLYDIEIYDEFQQKGYGKQTMTLLEELAKDMGADHIQLNVFGNNETAYNLYKKMGYSVSARTMMKKI